MSSRLPLLPHILATLTLFSYVVWADLKPVTDFNFYNSSALGEAPLQSFHTLNYSLPLFQKKITKPKRTDGSEYLFFTPAQGSSGVGGPMVYDAKTLSPVYADMSFRQVGDLRIQRFDELDYLVFSGLNQPSGFSHCRLYDSSYRLAYTVSAVNISHELLNLHECQLTGDGTALITVDKLVPFDLSGIGGKPEGQIVDTIMQEIDIRTGELVFEWRASEHVEISESFEPVGNSSWWDFCHLNSFEKTREGNILLSMRHTGAIRYINGTDGSTIWQLGGKKNTFRDISDPDGAALNFSFQHFPRFVGGDLSQLTFFNNGGTQTRSACTDRCSRGMHVKLDHEASTVKLVQAYEHPKHLVVGAMGSMQSLSNGNVIISWGTFPTMTEYTPDGENIAELEWGMLIDHNAASYRGFKMNWTAKPFWPPSIATDGGTRVYLSWNGATEVKRWAVLSGGSAQSLDGPDKVVTVIEKVGFETQVLIPKKHRFVRAAALDTDGVVIGSTDVVDRTTGLLQPAENITSVTRCWATMFSCACEGITLQ